MNSKKRSAAEVFFADPLAACPCGSARTGRNCCLDDGGRIRGVPSPALVRAPAGETRNERCYASPLGGCSEKLSSEHYLSGALQREMIAAVQDKRAGKAVFRVSKMAWLQEGESRVVGRQLVSKVLCTSHNSALSALDRIGQVFGASIIRPAVAAPGTRWTESVLLNGEDFERWLLKVLCGVTAMEQRVQKRKWYPPLEWLNTLFKLRGEALPSGMGFWLNLSLFELMPGGTPSFSVTPIDDSGTADPLGLRLHLLGMEFVLIMRHGGRALVLRNARLRPGIISLDFGGGTVSLVGLSYRHSPLGMFLRAAPVEVRP